MLDYIERISLVGWLSRTQFQEIWVTFLAAVSPPAIGGASLANQNSDNKQFEQRGKTRSQYFI
jgi:hypothetical protein